jgi:hypothetical protein
MYTFMKVFHKTNLLLYFSHFQTQRLKSYLWFIFPMFDSNLIQNDFFYQTGGSTVFNLGAGVLLYELVHIYKI